MHFVIAGKINCPQFAFATIIAQRLKDSLPEFTFSRITKKSGDWEKWLMRICRENEWMHNKSPIIWREIVITKGKKYLVGDITQFLDLCQDHYGLTKEMISGEIFAKDEIKWFAKRSELDYIEDVRRKAEEHVAYRCRQVCILGAASPACDILIMELLHIPLQNRENGLEIRLYDDSHRFNKLKAMADDAKLCLGYSGLGSCRVAKNIREALYNVDLVIVLDSFPRQNNETLVKWLKRNRNAMCILGNALNKYARSHCRVIIGSPSDQPVCYNATVLASFATKLHVRNIVVVTQDLGRESLRYIAERTGVSLRELNCPPVWGFVGLNKYVDVRNTLQTYNYKVPGPHLTTNLPQGSSELEIRTVDPFLDNVDINKIAFAVMEHKMELLPKLGRIPQLAKITAILDLLKVWSLKQEDGNGEILSLGVYSDGTFNIPKGLYWSQPVTLEKGFWKPFARYPIPRRLDINLYSFFTLGVASLSKTKVTVRKQNDPKPIRKKKESRNFDLNILRESVKLPVVRTKAECLQLLKRLAREELDLQIDERKSLSTITEISEESSIETVPQEKIYCECWRQEILQLRKMATENSSTTEVEVDLSENISGSEWSVVNPPEPYASLTESFILDCECGPDCHCLEAQEMGSGKKIIENYNQQMSELGSDTDSWCHSSREPRKPSKEVRFAPSADPFKGDPKQKYKFYGLKDALVDEKKRKQALERIKRYERGGEDEEETGEDSSMVSEDSLYFRPTFHVNIDENYEIVGDQEGLEALEEMRRAAPKEPIDDFTEMWQDEVTPALQVLSTESDSSPETIETQDTADGLGKENSLDEDYGESREINLIEDVARERSSLEVIPEMEEDEIAPTVVGYVQVESKFGKAVEEKYKEEVNEECGEEGSRTDVSAKVRQKYKGIPLCCLCRCIVPEGERVCHCEEAKVLEVFKSESGEVILESKTILAAESEGSYSGMIEEKEGVKEDEGEKEGEGEKEEEVEKTEEREEEEEEGEMEEGEEKEGEEEEEEEENGKDEKEKKRGKEEYDEEEDEEKEDDEEEEEEIPKRKRRDIFSLPPESFFPFSPKRINKFIPSETPQSNPENTRNILDDLPPEYLEMMEEMKPNIPEEVQHENQERVKSYSKPLICQDFEVGEGNDAFDTSAQGDWRIKDWTTILKKKYKEWFENYQNVPDNLYYDMANEEPSDEECPIDKELSKYFED